MIKVIVLLLIARIVYPLHDLWKGFFFSVITIFHQLKNGSTNILKMMRTFHNSSWLCHWQVATPGFDMSLIFSRLSVSCLINACCTVCFSPCLSACLFFFLCVCPSVYLSVCLSACLSVCVLSYFFRFLPQKSEWWLFIWSSIWYNDRLFCLNRTDKKLCVWEIFFIFLVFLVLVFEFFL